MSQPLAAQDEPKWVVTGSTLQTLWSTTTVRSGSQPSTSMLPVCCPKASNVPLT